jgi:hypothetical protein
LITFVFYLIQVKPPRTNEELTFMGKEYFSFELPSGTPYSITYEEEFDIDFKTSRSTGLFFYSGNIKYF